MADVERDGEEVVLLIILIAIVLFALWFLSKNPGVPAWLKTMAKQIENFFQQIVKGFYSVPSLLPPDWFNSGGNTSFFNFFTSQSSGGSVGTNAYNCPSGDPNQCGLTLSFNGSGVN